jgi:merozoite surface protein 1
MDENIDELLIKINEYENKVLEMDGLIGQLGILLNNISGWIESFFN